MRRLLVLTMLTVVLTGNAKADTFTALGLTCFEWIVARADRAPSPMERASVAPEQWIVGFLSGVVAVPAAPAAARVAVASGAEAAWAWVDHYCAGHPGDNLTQAAQAYILAKRH
jgi:hypothetical protein